MFGSDFILTWRRQSRAGEAVLVPDCTGKSDSVRQAWMSRWERAGFIPGKAGWYWFLLHRLGLQR